jgi:hypothetical protein
MKFFKQNNKFYFNSLLIFALVATSFFSLPGIGVFAGTDTPPTITIDSPSDNDLLHQMTIRLSGTFSDVNDGISLSNLLFTAVDQITGKTLSNSDSNPNDWTLSTSVNNGKWTFKKRLTEDGTHTLIIKIEEKPPLSSANLNQDSVTFTIDTRPYIMNTGVIFKENNKYEIQTGDTLKSIAQNKLKDSSLWSDIAQVNGFTSSSISQNTVLTDLVQLGTEINLPTKRMGEDLTSIPKDTIIKIQIADDKSMNRFVDNINNNNYQPIKVLDTTSVTGTTNIFRNPEKESGNYIYDVFFKPDENKLTLNKTYLAYLDPTIVDDSDGPVYAKFFKFTTKSNAAWDDLDDQSHDSSNPHGHYQLNTNMCAACHSTHVDSPYQKGITNQLNVSREGGSYLIDFNEELNLTASNNYCVACHDGTLNNAPIVNGIEKTYHHDNPADYDKANGINRLKEATSCTSCHNPHLEWSDSNPNLLKDHFVYTHLSTVKDQDDNDMTTVDTLNTSCETCHKDNLIHNNDNTVTSIYSLNNYEVLAYKKSLTSTGSLSNYALCLRCHKAGDGAADIETFYKTNSGHTFTPPNDDIGSKLNGQLPCAECHETHGSNNMKMLKETPGNVQSDDKFISVGTTWNAENDRKFCLSCHSTSTEIYGKKADFNTTDVNGPIDGHQLTDTNRACSSCHSSSYDKSKKDDPTMLNKAFMEAAHAPKKGIQSNDVTP